MDTTLLIIMIGGFFVILMGILASRNKRRR
jgi:hypothetical protein